jgi:hypothetical protein
LILLLDFGRLVGGHDDVCNFNGTAPSWSTTTLDLDDGASNSMLRFQVAVATLCCHADTVLPLIFHALQRESPPAEVSHESGRQ